MSRATTWLKMLGAGVVMCVGGPALVQYLRPSDEELIKRYNPELRKRSEEQGEQKAREFDDFVTKLKEWSKSDKSIWIAAQEQADQQRADHEARTAHEKEEAKIQREEMRKELLGEKR